MSTRALDLSEAKVRYITENGKRVAVVLDLSTFDALRERLEALEDALELKEARLTAEGFIDLDKLKQDLAGG